MKTEHKIIAFSIIFGLFAWVIDAFLDYVIFYEGTFWGLLIFDVPRHEVYIRSVMLVSFTIFGLIVSGIVAKRERAEGALRRANRAYRVLSDCNQTLVRAADEESLLRE